MSHDKLIERIRRLLALSTSSNVHEAAAAAAKATQLMAEHQIEQAEIDLASGEVAEVVIETDTFDESSRGVPWRQILGHQLAEANGAALYGQRRVREHSERYTVLRLVGTRPAIQTVRYMHAYLCAEVERLCKLELKLHGGRAPRTYAGNFKLGAAVELARRIKEAALAAKFQAQQDGKGAALALIDKTTQRVQDMLPKTLRKATGVTLTNQQALAAGMKAAKGVPISSGPQLGRGAAGNLRGT